MKFKTKAQGKRKRERRHKRRRKRRQSQRRRKRRRSREKKTLISLVFVLEACCRPPSRVAQDAACAPTTAERLEYLSTPMRRFSHDGACPKSMRRRPCVGAPLSEKTAPNPEGRETKATWERTGEPFRRHPKRTNPPRGQQARQH